MYAFKGIGLAANQVALPYRFFVLNLTADPAQGDQEQVFFNPEIVKRHSSIEAEEGCLSFPGVYAQVRRARKIKLRAFDLAGEPVEVEATDLLAAPSSTRPTTSRASCSSTCSTRPTGKRSRTRSPRSRPGSARPRPRVSIPATPRSSGNSTTWPPVLT